MPAELSCSIVLVGNDRNKRRSESLSKWSRNVQRWSWWKSNVDAWLFRKMIPSWTAQENDRDNNIKSISQSSSRSSLRSRPIKPTNRSNQQSTNRSNYWLTDPTTDRSRKWLPSKPNKQLCNKANDNQEWLCKGANKQDDLNKRTTKNHWPTEQSRLSNSSESGRIAIK